MGRVIDRRKCEHRVIVPSEDFVPLMRELKLPTCLFKDHPIPITIIIVCQKCRTSAEVKIDTTQYELFDKVRKIEYIRPFFPHPYNERNRLLLMMQNNDKKV